VVSATDILRLVAGSCGTRPGSAAVSSPPVRLSSALQRLLATGDAHVALVTHIAEAIIV
jgi:hypothetical protein